jgi:RNA polymerase sigma-70 factor (ECF subfamily)
MARMRAIDAARHAARRPVRPVPPDELPERPAADDPAEAALEAQATREALALIAALPPDQAEVVALRVLAGLDAAQVGELLGKRPGTVRVLAHRGLRRLAQQLAERTGV